MQLMRCGARPLVPILIAAALGWALSPIANRAREILESNLDPLHRLAGALLRHETLDHEQIAAFVRGHPASN